MEILNFDTDTEYGFAWIEISGKNSDDRWSVQCCLADRSEEAVENGEDFELTINATDCGHDWGTCAEANEKAFDYWGENRCMTALFNQAKQAGVEVNGV